jgi:hypothetical protein
MRGGAGEKRKKGKRWESSECVVKRGEDKTRARKRKKQRQDNDGAGLVCGFGVDVKRLSLCMWTLGKLVRWVLGQRLSEPRPLRKDNGRVVYEE